MRRFTIRLYLAVICAVVTLPVAAWADFAPITSKSDFMQVISGKSLERFAISLHVSDAGKISGRGYGRDVTGRWQWNDGFFCRELFWGKRDLGPNCQQVTLKGNTIRFQSDRGTGRSADFTLR